MASLLPFTLAALMHGISIGSQRHHMMHGITAATHNGSTDAWHHCCFTKMHRCMASLLPFTLAALMHGIILGSQRHHMMHGITAATHNGSTDAWHHCCQPSGMKSCHLELEDRQHYSVQTIAPNNVKKSDLVRLDQCATLMYYFMKQLFIPEGCSQKCTDAWHHCCHSHWQH